MRKIKKIWTQLLIRIYMYCMLVNSKSTYSKKHKIILIYDSNAKKN